MLSTVAKKRFELTQSEVRRAVARALPEPLHEHYVVIDGARYPPKQVLALVTGLDRADFTTHQARRILRRLGFVVGRTSSRAPAGAAEQRPPWPHGGVQAEALAPHVGRWVAVRGADVLVAADTPQEILEWAERHEVDDADGMFRVPDGPAEGWSSAAAR